MSATSVTLEQVIHAASARAASLVPETSGYLALAIGDATIHAPFRLDLAKVSLSAEGTVAVSHGRDVVPPMEAAASLRALLGTLLERSVGTMPGLRAAARPRDEGDKGVAHVVEELEAALIPVNRSAARRALARLARETARAIADGKVRFSTPQTPSQRGVPRASSARPAAAAPPLAEPTAAPIEPSTPVIDEGPASDEAHDVAIDVIFGSGETPAPLAVSSTKEEVFAPTTQPTPTAVTVELAVVAMPGPTIVDALPLAEEAEPPFIDEDPTHLDVVTELRESPVSPVETPIEGALVSTPRSGDVCSERHTLPFGAPVAPAVLPVPVAPPTPPSVHVETVPMRFEVGRVALGAAPVTVEPAPLPEPAPVASEAVSDAPAIAERVVDAPVVAAPEVAPEPAPERPAPLSVETPTVPVRKASAAKKPWSPPKPASGADLGPVARSDVDELIARFSRSDLDNPASVNEVRASLKVLAEVDPTRLPPAVATNDRRPAKAPSPAPTEPLATSSLSARGSAASASSIPEPRQPSRAGLALSVTLLVAGILGTGAIWWFFPAFFTG